MFSVRISPASSVLSVGGTKNLRAIARDRSNRLLQQDLEFRWHISEGEGALENTDGEILSFNALPEPGLTQVRLTAKQGGIECIAEALITVTDSPLPETQTREGTEQGFRATRFRRRRVNFGDPVIRPTRTWW